MVKLAGVCTPVKLQDCANTNDKDVMVKLRFARCCEHTVTNGKGTMVRLETARCCDYTCLGLERGCSASMAIDTRCWPGASIRVNSLSEANSKNQSRHEGDTLSNLTVSIARDTKGA